MEPSPKTKSNGNRIAGFALFGKPAVAPGALGLGVPRSDPFLQKLRFPTSRLSHPYIRYIRSGKVEILLVWSNLSSKRRDEAR